jgi:cobalt-zinc-cadmium resistance protein CzcA
MTETGRRIGRTLRNIPGAGDVRVERALGLPMLEIEADRGRLSRYGMNADDVLAAVEASRQGRRVGQVYEGRRRFDLRVVLPPAEPGGEGFRRLPVGSFEGQLVPLGQVAQVAEVDGPAQISRAGMQRRLRIEVNIRGRDLVSFVDEARRTVSRDVPLAAGYRLEWGGQFENFERATARLAIVLPLSLAIIFGMLFLTFGNVRYAIAVFSGVPFALIGGVLSLAAREMAFSIPAAVGFIALCGIAVLNGVVMASEVQRRLASGEALEHAVTEGSVSVLRAVLLTATVAAIGFLPMAISSSAGSEVQRPLATAVMGGVVSSTLLGLFVLPGLLRIFLGGLEARAEATSDDTLAASPAE